MSSQIFQHTLRAAQQLQPTLGVLGPAINLAMEDATLRWFPDTEGEHLNWLWHDE
jgi:hypothetical protein